MKKTATGTMAAARGFVLRVAALLVARAQLHPRRTLVFWLLITLLPIGGLTRLRHDTDGQAMAPRGDEAIRLDRQTRELFDLRDQLIVLLDSGQPDGIFEPHLLATTAALTDQLLAFPEFERRHVFSLRTEPRKRLFAGWSETYSDFLTPLPQSARQLKELREDLDESSSAIYSGTILTADRGGTAILVGIPGHGELDREALFRRIESLVEPFRSPGLRIDVVGAPAAEATLASGILHDLALLIPLSVLVIAVVLRLGTGRWTPVLLVLPKVLANLLFTFGLLGWLGWPVYLTVAIVPVVLAAMSLADEIHVLTRYQRALSEQEAAAAIATTYEELTLPVVAATLTTCAGFLACLPSRILPVQALGVAAAIGTFYSLLFTLTATPALLRLLPTRLFLRKVVPPSAGARSASLPWALRHRKGVLVGFAALCFIAILGSLRVEIQDSWIDHFSRRDPLRQATERVNQRLYGVHRLEVRLDFPEEGAFRRPDILAAIAKFEAALATRPDIGGVLGPHRRLQAVAEFWNLGEEFRRGKASDYLLSRFDFAPGQLRRQQVITDDHARGLLTLFLKNANYRDTAQVMTAVAKHHAELLGPLGGRFVFAGDVAVSQTMIPAVVYNQMLSLPLALVCVFLVVWVLCLSPRLAAYSLLPVAASGLFLLGGLGFSGIPLGVASSMFFVLALGLGVDSHSIHLVLRVRELQGDVPAALGEVRRPILLNTLAVGLGFGLLMLSQVPANRTMGWLITLGLGLGCLLTLTALAALLASAHGESQAKSAKGEKTEPTMMF